MTDAERLEQLRQKLEKRRDTPGYEANVTALEEEVARLEDIVNG